MASILEGYSHDVFISYRQNDNRSGWVTAFVEALQEELAATIKEPVSVYFDTNPHDGLLETHNVDKSLEGRLRCLIFIPILSQTYCDPKSFAWQQEFCVFNKNARADTFGREIKLSNGNVASRVLPIVIHELDAEDRQILEAELGPIRSIEFIFRAAGVNRPLQAKDDELASKSGQPLYRNQINKTANAIKALLGGMTRPVDSRVGVTPALKAKKPKTTGMLSLALALALVLSVAYIFFPRGDEPISIAVLAFKDMSEGGDQEHFSDGISEELINMLTHVPGLEVTARTSSFKFKDEKEDIPTIARKLNVEYVLEGSVRQTRDRIRITAQLIVGETGKHVWSKNFEREKGDVLRLEDDIALEVLRSLKGTLLNESLDFGERQPNQEALNLFLQGKYNTMHHKPDAAINYFRAALRIDSLYTKAWAGLAWAYNISSPHDSLSMEGMRERVARYAKKAFSINPRDPDALRSMIQMYLADLNFAGARNLVEQSHAAAMEDPELLDFVAFVYWIDGKVDEGNRLLTRSCQKDPLNYLHHSFLSRGYLKSGDLRNAELHIRTAIDLSRDIPWSKSYLFDVHFSKGEYEQALSSIDTSLTNPFPEQALRKFFPLFAMGRQVEANQLLNEVKSRYKDISFSQVATCFAFAGKTDSALYYLEKARKEKDTGLLFVLSDPLIPAGFKNDPRLLKMFRELSVIE